MGRLRRTRYWLAGQQVRPGAGGSSRITTKKKADGSEEALHKGTFQPLLMDAFPWAWAVHLIGHDTRPCRDRASCSVEW